MDTSIKVFTPQHWTDYELIDSGNGEKLEQFGKYTFVRPDPKVLWHKTADQKIWNDATAQYLRSNTGGGRWIYKKQLPNSWTIAWKNLTFKIKPTGFKHLGCFPEQAALWDWIIKKIEDVQRPISVLNLFAYTGGSTLAAASVGAAVTHIDSEKEILTWARENATLSKLDDKQIRWIPEDALTFVKREVKRGKTYDAIIMDPPRFGRGSKHEVWKLEDDMPKLLDLCQKLLSPTPLFIMVNAYAVSYSSITLANMLTVLMNKNNGKIKSGELALKQTSNNLILPCSIFALWEKK